MYQITCPYCFRTFSHRAVHFRSERVSTGECDILPDDYYDINDFQARYQGQDKERILAMYRDWDFFRPVDDPEYSKFWNGPDGFGGTSERDPAGEKLGVLAFNRRVLNPGDISHQRYLRQQRDGGFLIYDQDGFATNVELLSGESCNRRVCPHCHNPLPPQYGKHPVKFTTVIGITGAGKTVYLAQLIRNLSNYAAKVGLSCVANNAAARLFLDENRVIQNQPLPGASPSNRLLQPLFYDLIKTAPGGRKETQTFVLFDVAGENCVDPDLMHRFGRFIEHAHGIFLLIDPKQFDVIRSITPYDPHAGSYDEPASSATAVLDAIHNLVAQGKADEKCRIPMAVCISKSDTEEMRQVMVPQLCDMMVSDVEPITDQFGRGYPVFNAANYSPIAYGLHQFVLANEPALEQTLFNNYAAYNYFAFSALGCDVQNGCPVGPILPKRIEEPLLWLFYRFGYLAPSGQLYTPAPEFPPCPQCGGYHVAPVPEAERAVTVRHFLRKETYYVTYQCGDCGYRW